MELDREICFRASASRDARFDGRFFIGVRTTGVYCRPICPAPSPKPENVTFHATAAAAEAAGLRPCRRCRPETAPGTPEWLGGPAVVARALRLIDEGYLDRRDAASLAGELCVSERQLRRLFEAHLGAPPGAVARTRRLRLARQLIDQTDLSMADVSAAAGFTSLRRFNEAVRSAYGRPPRELRRARRGRASAGIELRLPYRPPYAWAELIGFLAERAIPSVEAVDGGVLRRALRIDGEAVVVEVEHGDAALHLRADPAPVTALAGLAERCRAVFDVAADPVGIAESLGGDPTLGPLVRDRPGLRVPGAWDGFELAVRAVLGQQVSVRGATTLAGRLARRFGDPLPVPRGSITHLFPRPEALAAAPVEAIGMPAARAETIRVLARAVAVGELELAPSAPFETTRRRLGAIPGIGDWTVEYVAMRALRDPDAFPAGDLGLRRALGVSPREVSAWGERWRPWRAYAALHLWNAGDHLLREAA